MVALAEKTSSSVIDKTYIQFLDAKLLLCSENPEKIAQGNARLDEFLKENPEDLRFYILRHFFLGGDVVQDQLAERIRNKALPNSEFERILFADMSFEIKEAGLSTINSFLDFHSLNPEIESYRLYLSGVVSEIRGNFPQSYDYFFKSLEISPHFFSTRLIPFLTGPVEKISKEDPSKIEPFINRIKDLDDRDPSKILLEVMVSLRARKVDEEKNLDQLKRAYEECHDDSRVALGYARALAMAKLPQKSYDISKKFIAAHKYHSVSWESQLINTSLWLKKWEEGKGYINDAKSTFQYKEDQNFHETIDKYVVYMQKHKLQQLVKIVSWIIAAFILMGLLVLAYFLAKNSSGREITQVQSYPEGTNIEELNSAEAKAHDEQKNYAIIRTFNSEKGFREPDMIEMVSYLNGQGIDASYTTSLLYINQTYSLQVRVEQMKLALEILENYKKT